MARKANNPDELTKTEIKYLGLSDKLGFVYQDAAKRLSWPNGKSVARATLDKLIARGAVAETGDGLFPGHNQTFKRVPCWGAVSGKMENKVE